MKKINSKLSKQKQTEASHVDRQTSVPVDDVDTNRKLDMKNNQSSSTWTRRSGWGDEIREKILKSEIKRSHGGWKKLFLVIKNEIKNLVKSLVCRVSCQMSQIDYF
jgi:hypothetical protein